MTYCVGLRLQGGLVMLADTRTNAGVDNIATFCKLHVVEIPGERMICLAVKSLPTVTPFSRPIPTPLGGEEWAYPRSA